MKKHAALLLVSAALLAGCSAEPAAIPSGVYYELVREGNLFTTSTDADLDVYAQETCDLMRDGDDDTSWLLGLQFLTDAGMEAGDAGAFLAYAASYRCSDLLEHFPHQ